MKFHFNSAIFKHISTQCMIIYMVLVSIWNGLPEAFQNSFTSTDLKTASVVLIAVGLIGKFVDQGLSHEKPNDD